MKTQQKMSLNFKKHTIVEITDHAMSNIAGGTVTPASGSINILTFTCGGGEDVCTKMN